MNSDESEFFVKLWVRYRGKVLEYEISGYKAAGTVRVILEFLKQNKYVLC